MLDTVWKLQDVFEYLSLTQAKYTSFENQTKSSFETWTREEKTGGALQNPEYSLDCRLAAFLLYNHLTESEQLEQEEEEDDEPFGLEDSCNIHYNLSVIDSDTILEKLSSQEEILSELYDHGMGLVYFRFEDYQKKLVADCLFNMPKTSLQYFSTCSGYWMFVLPPSVSRDAIPMWARDPQTFNDNKHQDVGLYLGFGTDGWRVYSQERVKDLLFEAWKAETLRYIEQNPVRPLWSADRMSNLEQTARNLFTVRLKMLLQENEIQRESIEIAHGCSTLVCKLA